MKQLLTKGDVAQAIKDLEAQGKKVTCTALHAAVGNRGSMSTLLKLKAEIQGAPEPVADSPAGLKAFREVWLLAVSHGQQLQQSVIVQLREELKALAIENERLEGKAISAESEREHTLAELKGLQIGTVKAIEETNRSLSLLADERAAHGKEMDNIRQELVAEVRKVHELQMELVGRDPGVRGVIGERSQKTIGFEAHSNGTASAKRAKGGK